MAGTLFIPVRKYVAQYVNKTKKKVLFGHVNASKTANMSYILRNYEDTRKEYEDTLENHNVLFKQTFHTKKIYKRDEELYLAFHRAAKPVLKKMSAKRKKLATLTKWSSLQDKEVLGDKLPSILILKVAEFIPDKISLENTKP